MNGLALCAGIGGLELGIKRAIPEYKTVCYVEQDAYAATTLMARMEDKALDKAPIWDDITTFDSRKWRGAVDLVTAGFPCQPFSLAGRKERIEDERWLWPEIDRILCEIGPPIVFLENVPELAFQGLSEVLKSLALLRYDARWDCFRASDVDAPHKRKRMFILAHSANFNVSIRKEFKTRFQAARYNRWSPEPNICRVDDGTPFRVDRLKCLGNAVVPQQAEYAFRKLWNHLIVNSPSLNL